MLRPARSRAAPAGTHGKRAVSVELAHITDPHLPLAGARPAELLGKRVLGWLSWTLRRRHVHRREALDAIVADIRRQAENPHIVITGDLVNVSTRAEFAAARQWLERLATPENLTLIPGNHDFYVAAAARAAGGLLAPWMGGANIATPASFPFVRYVGNVALIGLNSAYPAPWREASGRLGGEQLRRLEEILRQCERKGFCRVVLVHHPPLPALNTKPRKALKDADALARTLATAGAELVLFGHTHRWACREVPLAVAGASHDRKMLVLSAPSASMAPGHEAPPAGWQHIRIGRSQGEWNITVTRRALRANGEVEEQQAFTRHCPA